MWRAVRTFAAGRRVIAEGQEVAADDPIVRGREQLFQRVVAEGQEKPPPRRRRRRAASDDSDGA